MKTLGKFFSRTLVVQPEHKVVDNGPYAIVIKRIKKKEFFKKNLIVFAIN